MIMPVTHSLNLEVPRKNQDYKTEEVRGSSGFENILSQISSTPKTFE